MLDTKIYTLLKVAETGSFTRAAASLGLTQPAVSQHIKALEEELGITLFERNGNRIILTKQGENAVNTANAMLGMYSKLLEELSGSIGGTKEINIGITHTIESNRITDILAGYASNSNRLTIKLITGTRSKIIRRLKNYELDLAIVDGDVPDEDLDSKPLGMDQLVLIVSPDNTIAQKKAVSIDDIKREKLILRLPGSGTNNMFKSSIESLGLDIDEFNVILEVDNVATIKDLVKRDYGVSVLPRSACLGELKSKQLYAVSIDKLNMERIINIVYTDGSQYASFAEEIINLYGNDIL